jgi:cyclic pyranopterin phosphate synthase
MTVEFNHFDGEGRAHMVDICAKQPTERKAVAQAVVNLGPALTSAVRSGGLAKGDVLGVARLAGLSAVKQTAQLIPLAHPLAIHHAAVVFDVDEDEGTVTATCTVQSLERTGMEMEAMTGASLAALTIYDMCKGTDKSITIGPVRLLFKSGGKSGTYQAGEEKD